MGHLQLSLLGSFEARIDGRLLTSFQSDKGRALLAYLAMEPGRSHDRIALVDLLWPEHPERRGRANLSQAIYNIRNVLREPARYRKKSNRDPEVPFLLTEGNSIQLNPDADISVDATEFTDFVNQSQRHVHRQISSCEECMVTLDKAASLYRGDFIHGLNPKNAINFEEWSRFERERLKQLALYVFFQLAEGHLQRGSYEIAQQWALRQVALDPLLEAGHRQLMRLMTLNGQRNGALAHYNACRQLLERELGVNPELETTALCQRIRDEEGLAQPQQEKVFSLPTFLVPLVGRKQEVAALRERLLDPTCRLLSVVGPGGSGKTRLALETAHTLVGRYAHGIHFVPLSAIDIPEGVIPAIARALGLVLDEKRPAMEQIIDYLRKKELLLLLDSFEGLLPGTSFVLDLLQAAPGLSVLVTSRVHLDIQAEQLFPLQGLEYSRASSVEDVATSEAGQLFLSGARRVQPTFELTNENQKAVAEICQLVEGMPLGILLAVAWVEALSPNEILVEIQRSYDFLQAGWVDVPHRQRSLRATFEYSWSLLSPEERRLFPQLSIFRGGFTRQAAELVTGISTSELRELIGKSLLNRAASGRYDMHDMVRQYGTEKLALISNAADFHERHASYYLDLLTRNEARLKSGHQQEALNEIEMEYGNIRAAWDWAVVSEDVSGMESAMGGLGLFCDLRVRYQEGLAICRSAAAKLEVDTPIEDRLPTLALVQIWHARFHRLLGDSEQAQQLHAKCQEYLDDVSARGGEENKIQAFLLLEMGNAAQHTNREAASQSYQESLDLYRSLKDGWGTAYALAGLGEIVQQTGTGADSIALYAESLDLFRTLGDPRGTAAALTGLGNGLFRVGRLKEGEELIRERNQIYEELGDRAGVATGLLNLARAFYWQGRYAELLELVEQGLPMLKDLGLRFDAAFLLGLSAIANPMLGNYEQASVHAQEVRALSQELHYPRFLATSYGASGMIAAAERDFEQTRVYFQEYVNILGEVGSNDEQAAGVAWLAFTHLKMGDNQQARRLLVESMETVVKLQAVWSASWTLPVVAIFMAERGNLEKAMEVYTVANRLPIVANSLWIKEVVGEETIELVSGLSSDAAATAQKRGQEADVFAIAAELLSILEE